VCRVEDMEDTMKGQIPTSTKVANAKPKSHSPIYLGPHIGKRRSVRIDKRIEVTGTCVNPSLASTSIGLLFSRRRYENVSLVSPSRQ